MCLKKLEKLKDDIYNALAIKFTISDNVSIYINSEDIDCIPHFHYVHKDGFVTTIRMDKEEYLNTSKTLSNDEKGVLQDFLEMPFKNQKFFGTNWDFLVMSWNMNNDIQLDEEQKLDYRNLK